ncbi:hypothetical protein ES703_109462 [subsurface metagenome]
MAECEGLDGLAFLEHGEDVIFRCIIECLIRVPPYVEGLLLLGEKNLGIAVLHFREILLADFVFGGEAAVELDIFAATISMAEAIVKAFTAGPFIGQVMAGIVAGLSAIQIAAIASAPLPALQRGGRITELGGIVGEAGPELFVPERPGMIIPLRREAAPISPPMTRMRIIIQNRITVGEQTFYRESVKSVNKAGELRELKIPNEVVV